MAATSMDGYFFYNGQVGTYSRTFEYKKNPNCFTCGAQSISYATDATKSLGELKDGIESK